MKMKELGLLFMMLCMVFAVNAQELKKGDKLPDFHLKSAVYGDCLLYTSPSPRDA